MLNSNILIQEQKYTGVVTVSFPYSKEMVEAIKAIPVRKSWDGNGKVWAFEAKNLELLEKTFPNAQVIYWDGSYKF